eukprot:33913-Amphidinium_carterae.2
MVHDNTIAGRVLWSLHCAVLASGLVGSHEGYLLCSNLIRISKGLDHASKDIGGTWKPKQSHHASRLTPVEC